MPKLPGFGTDEFAYVVAGYAWRDGLTANAIVRTLGLPSKPENLMHVKRALKRAHKNYLRIVTPDDEQLRIRLGACINVEGRRIPITFHVVKDDWGPSSGPVFAKAAALVSEFVADLVRKKRVARISDGKSAGNEPPETERDIVICNAGGRTVSEMVKALVRNPPVLSESDEESRRLAERLHFVAANAAYLPDSFHLSANFLSVTMAELFGADHYAMAKVEDVVQTEKHEQLVENAALFICGAGTCVPGSQSGLMSRYFANQTGAIPEHAIGDIAFNLLDQNGFPVELQSEEARRFISQVNPTLNANRLMHIAANSRVLLILDSPEPALKRKIGAAVLKREYATDVVLGSSLAREVLSELGPVV